MATKPPLAYLREALIAAVAEHVRALGKPLPTEPQRTEILRRLFQTARADLGDRPTPEALRAWLAARPTDGKATRPAAGGTTR